MELSQRPNDQSLCSLGICFLFGSDIVYYTIIRSKAKFIEFCQAYSSFKALSNPLAEQVVICYMEQPLEIMGECNVWNL